MTAREIEVDRHFPAGRNHCQWNVWLSVGEKIAIEKAEDRQKLIDSGVAIARRDELDHTHIHLLISQ